MNSVPADVRMETFVRGNNLAAIADADMKVDRALRAAAMAIGATVEITTLPGYMPMRNDDGMMSMYSANAALLVGEENVGGQDTARARRTWATLGRSCRPSTPT